MVTIASVVRKILGDAINHVSDDGKMIFSMRSLWYAVRQLFLTRFFKCPGVTRGMLHVVCGAKVKLKEQPDLFVCEKGHEVRGEDLEPTIPGLRFYKEYNSFTQDFLRTYEKKQGKIKGMWREERGEYTYPGYSGSSFTMRVGGRKNEEFREGVGNKVILVEKAGIYGILAENMFDRRLDGVILSTEGYSIEKARELLEEAEKRVKICVLHDYDINGLLIKETLTKPTKRLDIHVNKVVDLGLDWEIVNVLMRERGLIPEPVELKKGDVAKLEGLLERKEVSGEEYRFLMGRTNAFYDAWKRGEKTSPKTVLARGFRVEIQALRPSELIKWLEERLEGLDLWKTVPSQGELDGRMREAMEEKLGETKIVLVDDLSEAFQEEVGLTHILNAIGALLNEVEAKLNAQVSERMEDIDFPTEDLDEFKEQMRENMLKYWTALAEELASMMVEELEEPLREDIENDRMDIVSEAEEDEDVDKRIRNLAEVLKTWTTKREYR